MKKTLFCITILIIFTTIFTSTVPSITYADTALYIEQAQNLKTLGLFKGTDKGFELERSPTRAEGAVMMVRLLGKEQYALNSSFIHPFTDVPAWADPYVGYMYHYSLTNGISDTAYGSNLPVTDIQFVTFVLRALGYDDKNNDFSYIHALEKALEIYLLNEQEIAEIEDLPVFLRNNVVFICYRALIANLKDSNKTLVEKLIFDENAVSMELAQSMGLYNPIDDYSNYDKTFQLTVNEYGYVVNNLNDMVSVLEKSIYYLDDEIKIDIGGYGAAAYTDFKNALDAALKNIEKFTGLRNILSVYNYSGTYLHMEVKLTYMHSEQHIETQKQQLQLARTKAQEIIYNIIKPCMSEYDKELAIHDYIVNNTSYDYDNYIKNEIPDESYTYYGVLVLGKAVCQGYADTMKLLCDMAGIECIVVSGESYSFGNWGGHAWNIVKIDNEYYHVDTTFNDPIIQNLEQVLRYHYFNLTDAEISLNHRWEKNNYPECTSTASSYYYKSKLVVEDFEGFKTRLQQAINDGVKDIELKITGFLEEEYNNLADVIFETGKVSSYHWSIDKNLGIIRIQNIEYRT